MVTLESGVPPQPMECPDEKQGEANDAYKNGAESLFLIQPKSEGTRNGAMAGLMGGRCMAADVLVTEQLP